MAVLSDAQREAGWTVAKLGDIATVITGQTPSKKFPEHWGKKGEIPFLTPKDQAVGVRSVDTERYISKNYIDIYKKRVVPAGSVALTCIGSSLGKISVTRHVTLTNQQINSIVADESKSNNLYIYYYLILSYDSLESLAGGTVMPIVNKTSLEGMEIPLPPLEEQERIAGILGSLDDKIEANTRLIQTLEDYVDAMIAKISKSGSFKRVAIKDLAIHEKNQELPREHVEGVIHHYSLPAYDSGKTPGVEEADSIKSNKFIIDKPCVLFSKLNPGTPRIWFVNPEEGIKSYASTEFIVLTPKENVDIANLWAACSEERISQNLADMASGTSTSHQRVRPADILNSKVLDLNDQSEIRSITSYIEALRKENLQLAATRDALIKRLIG